MFYRLFEKYINRYEKKRMESLAYEIKTKLPECLRKYYSL